MTTKTKKAKSPATKAKVNPDAIVTSTGMVGGEHHIVKSAGGKELILPTSRWGGEIRAASAIGSSFAALEQLWAKATVARLARGVDSRAAPHASKAVQDNAAKAKGAPKAKPAKPAKVAKAKGDKPAVNADRKYKPLVKLADIALREGTWTETMVRTIMAHTSTAAAQAAMDTARSEFKGRKLDFKWAADVRKYIQFS